MEVVVVRLVGFIFDCLKLDVLEVGLFGLGNGRGVWISLKFLEHGGARIPIRRVEVNWHGAKSKQVGRAGGARNGCGEIVIKTISGEIR